MKSLLLFPVLLLCFLNLKSQDYQPMSVEGAHWLIFSIVDGTFDHHFLSVEGDTALGGLVYKKVYKKKIQSQASSVLELVPPYFIDQVSLTAFLRDDTLDRKVYTYPTTNEWGFGGCEPLTDELIHDFSLNPGDTLNTCLHTDPAGFPITVDSVAVQFLWGKNRRTFFLSDGIANTDGLVEGVGIIGPFWPAPSFFPPENPSILVDYCVGSDVGCGLLPTATNEVRDDWDINIYPNPAAGEITMELSGDLFFPLEISVYDPLGKLFYHKTIKEKQLSVKLDLDDFPLGLLLLFFQNEEGIAAKRLVKN